MCFYCVAALGGQGKGPLTHTHLRVWIFATEQCRTQHYIWEQSQQISFDRPPLLIFIISYVPLFPDVPSLSISVPILIS